MVDGVSGALGFVIRKLEKRKESENVSILLHSMEDNTVLVIIMIKEYVQVRSCFKIKTFVCGLYFISYQLMEGGVSGDLGLVISLQDEKAGPGNVTILLLAMMDFLVLAIERK